jgi:hypothetical protein
MRRTQSVGHNPNAILRDGLMLTGANQRGNWREKEALVSQRSQMRRGQWGKRNEPPLQPRPFASAGLSLRRQQHSSNRSNYGRFEKDCRSARSGTRYYAQWAGNPPDVEYFRPDWKPEEMTWWQVYETVTEGTPVTPPFATQEELIEYLVTHGDSRDQQRGAPAWTRKQAEKFVLGTGFAPSLVISQKHGVQTGVEALDNPKEDK